MNFKAATDALFERVDHSELAQSLGVSIASVRQARLSPEASAYRGPPKNWKFAVIRLAERDIMHKRDLIQAVRDAP